MRGHGKDKREKGAEQREQIWENGERIKEARATGTYKQKHAGKTTDARERRETRNESRICGTKICERQS